MEQTPDVIIITAKHEEDISAERADVLVAVEGSSLVTGRAALRKAKEVSRLVEELEKCGLTQDDIGLRGVHATVSSGILGKSSSATYRLDIRCSNLELLPDVLGAITSAKNTQLEGVIWRYPESAEQQARWLQACIAQANIKAEAVAGALGARLAGVHRLTERRLEEPDHRPGAAFESMKTRSKSAAIQLGFDLSHQKRDGIEVTIEYLLEGFRSVAQ